MTIHTFYRLAIWMPMAVPALTVVLVHGYGYRPGPELKKLTQLLLMMFLYGGIPYTALALGATFWIGRRPEPEIIRVALRAPFLMVAAFVLFAVFILVRSRNVGMFVAFSMLGAVASLVIGYLCVGLVAGVRQLLAITGLLPPLPFVKRGSAS